MAEELLKRAAASFPNWTRTPIPGFNVSAGGVIALADLSTIAQRTAIAGGSSWLDALLLAPGLHYQQAADALANGGSSGMDNTGGAGPGGSPSYAAIEQLREGKTSTYNITNPATVRYLQRLAATAQRDGYPVMVDVGTLPERRYYWASGRGRRSVGQRANIWKDQPADLGWVSHLLYLASPILTIAAFVFMILLQEWWGVGLLLSLMLSRVLNIWVIKQRAKLPPALPKDGTTKKPPPPRRRSDAAVSPSSTTSDYDDDDSSSSSSAGPPEHHLGDVLTSYLVDLGAGRTVCLRGLADDLQAITTTTWLAAKTHVDGYLEAFAKLLVFVVAALSGNMSQAGGVIFMALLLVTAGLLGLSNAHATTLRMHGRVAAPTQERLVLVPAATATATAGGRGNVRRTGGGGGGGPPYRTSGRSFTTQSTGSSSLVPWPSIPRNRPSIGVMALDDFAEKGQIGSGVRNSFPLLDRAHYR
ncbi:hypothetical protein PG994_004628 [Apiospora phragmitis]|uniref:Uncharacterized protein n=1 Tax=Apiospora phragmitis TaxID=2905665 RepID=A0ABR1VV00_9PEZI